MSQNTPCRIRTCSRLEPFGTVVIIEFRNGDRFRSDTGLKHRYRKNTEGFTGGGDGLIAANSDADKTGDVGVDENGKAYSHLARYYSSSLDDMAAGLTEALLLPVANLGPHVRYIAV